MHFSVKTAPGLAFYFLAERNSDDGQTENQADNGIIETDQNASKHQPKYVTYKFNVVVIQASTLCRPWCP